MKLTLSKTKIACDTLRWDPIEFSLNVFIEFGEVSDKEYLQRKGLFKPATSCVRDKNVTTDIARRR